MATTRLRSEAECNLRQVHYRAYVFSSVLELP